MRKDLKKVTVCVLAVMLGLSFSSYSVSAIETDHSSDVGELMELNEDDASVESTDMTEETTTESQSATKTESTEKLRSLSVDDPQADDPQADDEELPAVQTAGAFQVEGGTSDEDWVYDSSQNTLTFKNGGTYKITGTGNQTQERIVVSAGFTGTITIENINIVSTTQTPFSVDSTANLTLIIEGTNILKAGGSQGHAGLEFNDASGNAGLIITGTGKLTATGGTYTGRQGGAGIGGSTGHSGNNIRIEGGEITAQGGNYGAGIGGGAAESGDGNNITINGGTVVARGGTNAAGIGGGTHPGNSASGSGTNITINGGNVTATGNGNAAGIGAGAPKSTRIGKTENITINGGAVTATSIGAVNTSSTTEGIYINGGSVKVDSLMAAPVNEENKPVYLLQMESQEYIGSVSAVPVTSETAGLVDTTDIEVDNADGEERTYERDGSHSSDNTFYLYLTGENHRIGVNGEVYYVVWNGSDGFTISDIPAPTFIIRRTAWSLAIELTNYETEYGEVQYKWDEGEWGEQNALSDLQPDSSHTVSVKYLGSDGDTPSAEAVITVSTLKDGALLVQEKTPTNLEATFEETLSDVELSSDWEWTTPDTPVVSGIQNYAARFNTSSYESEYDFSQVDGYNKDEHYVESNLSVGFIKATNQWTQELSITGWLYGKYDEEKNAPAASSKYGEVTFAYSKTEDGDYTAEVPKAAGTWYVKATVEETADYTGLEAIKEFRITVIALPQPPVNNAPVIIAENRTVTVGDHFSPLEGVTAIDLEDGDLTNSIIVIKNTVNTLEAGTYEVIYEVTDKDGAAARKSIIVTIKDRGETQAPGEDNSDEDNKPNDNDNRPGTGDNTNANDNTNTGDSINTGVGTGTLSIDEQDVPKADAPQTGDTADLWIPVISAFLAAVAAIALIYRKKKKHI